MIDWTRMQTPAARAAEAMAERMAAARAECRRLILAAVPETTQMNLTAATAANVLSPTDRATFAAGLGWISAMRAAWPAIAAAGTSLEAASWPDVPAGVEALAHRF